MTRRTFLTARALPCPPGIHPFRARMAVVRGGLGRPRPSSPQSALRPLPSVAVASAQVIANVKPDLRIGSEATLYYSCGLNYQSRVRILCRSQMPVTYMRLVPADRSVTPVVSVRFPFRIKPESPSRPIKPTQL
jgi:hypothetical protein